MSTGKKTRKKSKGAPGPKKISAGLAQKLLKNRAEKSGKKSGQASLAPLQEEVPQDVEVVGNQEEEENQVDPQNFEGNLDEFTSALVEEWQKQEYWKKLARLAAAPAFGEVAEVLKEKVDAHQFEVKNRKFKLLRRKVEPAGLKETKGLFKGELEKLKQYAELRKKKEANGDKGGLCNHEEKSNRQAREVYGCNYDLGPESQPKTPRRSLPETA